MTIALKDILIMLKKLCNLKVRRKKAGSFTSLQDI